MLLSIILFFKTLAPICRSNKNQERVEYQSSTFIGYGDDAVC